MKLSARNVLKGTIKEINFGVVNCEVVVNTTQGETIVSVVTKESVDSMKLKVGKEVFAVVKASNVMLAVE
ncbi:MAG: transporter [Chloroflexi bacterium HGW-Chloroflexi-4]|nr:MAG: transporter [Chloroflexi bacterium HGW-Chloroflexi-4]